MRRVTPGPAIGRRARTRWAPTRPCADTCRNILRTSLDWSSETWCLVQSELPRAKPARRNARRVFASCSAIKQGCCHPWRYQISRSAGGALGPLTVQHQRHVQPESHRRDGHAAAEVELPAVARTRVSGSGSMAAAIAAIAVILTAGSCDTRGWRGWLPPGRGRAQSVADSRR
jgi:hypothetical protein